MNLADLANELSERGIWWQVAGFAIVGCVGVAILQIWEGSDLGLPELRNRSERPVLALPSATGRLNRRSTQIV